MTVWDVLRLIVDNLVDLFWEIAAELSRAFSDDEPLVRGRDAKGDGLEARM